MSSNEQAQSATPTTQSLQDKVEELLLKDPATMTVEEIKTVRQTLSIEREQLELLELRRKNKAAQAKEAELRNQQAQEARNYESLKRIDEQIQAKCNHSKGGTDTESLSKQGDDNKRSVIKHIGTFGQMWVLCTRCCKLWLPKDPQNGNKPTVGYEEATRFITDNKTSSSVNFGISAASVQ